MENFTIPKDCVEELMSEHFWTCEDDITKNFGFGVLEISFAICKIGASMNSFRVSIESTVSRNKTRYIEEKFQTAFLQENSKLQFRESILQKGRFNSRSFTKTPTKNGDSFKKLTRQVFKF